jgi:hypothetical protein
MPLITLKTNLKNLKYGKDRLGGGSSNQPYMTFPIDEGSTTPDPFKSFYIANRTTRDFPVRGGGFVEQLSNGLGSQTIASQIDKERIQKFLQDGERGPAFIRKQIGLQLSGPKMQTAEVNPNFKLDDFPGLIENTRLYNRGRNTLTSVQYAGNGVFLNRAGALPFNPKEKFYADTMKQEFLPINEDKIESINRLLILRTLKLTSRNSNPIQNISDFSVVNALGISLNRNNIFEYLGGPGSVYGVGSTTVRRSYYDTSEAVNKETSDGVILNRLTLTYDKIMEKKTSTSTGMQEVRGDGFTGPIQFPSTNKSVRSDYEDYRNNENFDGGFAGRKNSSWEVDGRIENRFYVKNTRTDKINRTSQFVFDSSQSDPWEVKKEDTDDLIKFVFECIDNDLSGEDVAIFFRAHLGQITDNHKASWNGFKYMGRGENFYTYQGVDRTFSTSFKLAIGSYQELGVVYNKLNYLISQVYPDYNLNTQFMRAPLMRLTIGDYLYRAYGYLESVDVSVDDKSSWEITDGQQLPHVLNVSFGYKIIEKTLPQRGQSGYNFTKFIGEPLFKDDQSIIDARFAKLKQREKDLADAKKQRENSQQAFNSALRSVATSIATGGLLR